MQSMQASAAMILFIIVYLSLRAGRSARIHILPLSYIRHPLLSRKRRAPSNAIPRAVRTQKEHPRLQVFFDVLALNYLPACLSSRSHTPSMYMMPSARSYRP